MRAAHFDGSVPPPFSDADEDKDEDEDEDEDEDDEEEDEGTPPSLANSRSAHSGSPASALCWVPTAAAIAAAGAAEPEASAPVAGGAPLLHERGRFTRGGGASLGAPRLRLVERGRAGFF